MIIKISPMGEKVEDEFVFGGRRGDQVDTGNVRKRCPNKSCAQSHLLRCC